MALKQTYDTFTQSQSGNVVFETSQNYIDGTVTASFLINGSTEVPVTGLIEIGGTYIQLEDAPSVGVVIRIYYSVRVSDTLDVDILQRLRSIEAQVEKQNQMLNILTQAVDNRVDKHTFRVWLKAMEKSFGKPILEQNLLGIQSVHQSSND